MLVDRVSLLLLQKVLHLQHWVLRAFKKNPMEHTAYVTRALMYKITRTSCLQNAGSAVCQLALAFREVVQVVDYVQRRRVLAARYV
jgi:hypothetical protein